jgi:hypothetical protein
VRFSEGAWHVEAPRASFGPYLSQLIAVQIAALHAKALIKAGRNPNILVHDRVGKQVALWPSPTAKIPEIASHTDARSS